MKRAVITGMGAVTPLGNNVSDFWKALQSGQSGAAPISRFDASNNKTQFACEVKNFDPLNYVEKKEARKLDLFTLYSLAAAEECIKDAGINEECDLKKAAVLIATGIGGMETFQNEVLKFGENPDVPRFNPFFITKMIPNIAAGQISIKYGFRGISYAISSACASSNNAIGNALDLIRMGRANMVLVGGSEAPVSQAAIGGFNAMKAMSTMNDSYTTASRPFDTSRDGFVLGEGAGILMVEELEHAVKRGARIYGELAGYGAASDAYHVAASHPDGKGAAQAMSDALEDAGLKPAEVDYINAHATSTPVGDISECKAIGQVFSSSLAHVQISATKSMTGHLLGAAGAVEAIACVKAMEQGVVPPTINLDERDSEISSVFQLTDNECVSRKVEVVLNNTFGFGGHTSTTVFRKFE